MRVITGLAKGRKLKAPRGMDTRPTTDRIKESLFDIVSARVAGANFLDLFAGTGAIGIEALSRGAVSAVFVEDSPKALKSIRENLALTGLADRAEVFNKDAAKAIENLSAAGRKFDIIFLDPPYNKDLIQTILKIIYECDITASGGLIITESSKLDMLPEDVGHLKLARQEKYGDTVLSFYQET